MYTQYLLSIRRISRLFHCLSFGLIVRGWQGLLHSSSFHCYNVCLVVYTLILY